MNTLLLQAGIIAGALLIPAAIAILIATVSILDARHDGRLSPEERRKKVSDNVFILVSGILFLAFLAFLMGNGCNDGPPVN